MSRYRVVDPHHVTPLHAVRPSRAHHVRELMHRLSTDGWEGRALIVEETSPNRYQAWTGTHRLAAARRLGMRVPILLISKDKWIRRWGKPKGLFVDEVGGDGGDFDKHAALMEVGDLLAARIMHKEIELNLGGDAQRCRFGTAVLPCL